MAFISIMPAELSGHSSMMSKIISAIQLLIQLKLDIISTYQFKMGNSITIPT